jgi:hypothetical protein
MFSHLKAIALVVCTAGVAAGCTEIEVHKHTGGNITGIPYTLPEKSFFISVEYQVTKCDVSSEGDILLFDVSKTVTATPTVRAGERFYIPYASLRNSFKDTDVTIESFDNSTLKSVSATIEDKSGPAITAAVGTVLRVAALTSSVPLAVSAVPLTKGRDKYCNSEIIAALDTVAAGKDAPAAPATEAQEKPALAAKAKKAATAAKPVNTSTTAVTADMVKRANDVLRSKVVVQWTPDKRSMAPGAKRTGVRVYPTDLLARWLTKEGAAKLNAPPKLFTEAILELDAPMVADTALGATAPGLILRQPAHGVLRVCDGLCRDNSIDASDVISATDHVVPQLGDYLIVPLKNRMFEKQTLAVTMSEDGALQKIGLHTLPSAAAALENLNTNLDAIKKDKDERKKEKEAALAAAESSSGEALKKTKEANDAVTACLEAQKKLLDLHGQPIGTCQ